MCLSISKSRFDYNLFRTFSLLFEALEELPLLAEHFLEKFAKMIED